MKIAAVKPKTGKPVLVENHKTYAGIAETEKWLNAKMPGWDEFILYQSIKKNGVQTFVVRHANQLTELPKYKFIGNLLVWLDNNYRDWERFVIGNNQYKVVRYEDCEVGMLVRQGVENTEENLTKQISMVIEKTDKGITVNQEGCKSAFEFKNREGRFYMEILCNLFNAESFTAVFGEAKPWTK